MPADAPTGAGNVTTGATASGTSVVANKPSSLANGDLLVAYCFSSLSAATWTAPSGWNQSAGQSTVRSTFAFYKPVPTASAETAPDYTFSFTGGSGRGLIIICRVTGADLSGPIDAAGTGTTTGVSTIVAPGVTTDGGPSSLLLGFWSTSNATTTLSVITPPGTEVANVSTAPAASSYISLSKETLTTAGATGTRTATDSPGAGSGVTGFLLAINSLAQTAATTDSGTLSDSRSLAGGLSTSDAAGTLTDASALAVNVPVSDSFAFSETATGNIPSYVASATPFDSGSGTVSSFTMTTPGAAIAGHTGFILVTWVGSAGETPPTVTAASGVGNDWTALAGPLTANNSGYVLFYRQLVGGDSSTVTVTLSGLARFVVAESAWYRNVDSVIPGPLGDRAGVSSSVTTLPAMTVSSSTTVVLLAAAERTTATGTVISSLSAGTVRRFTEGTGSSTTSAMLGDRQTLGVTSLSACTVTYNSASGNGAGLQVNLLPSSFSLDLAGSDSGSLSESSAVSAGATLSRSDTFTFAEVSSETFILDAVNGDEAVLTEVSSVQASTPFSASDTAALDEVSADVVNGLTAVDSAAMGEESELEQEDADIILTTSRIAGYWVGRGSGLRGDRGHQYRVPFAYSLAKTNGEWVDVTYPSEEYVNAAEYFFPGGHSFVITLELKAELIAAGYGDLINQEA